MNQKLKQFYSEDVRDRNNARLTNKEINNRDRQRRTAARKVLNEKSNLNAADYHHAALIFQHGESVKDFKKAHEFAVKAVEMEDDSARWLYAATLDRYLLAQGKP